MAALETLNLVGCSPSFERCLALIRRYAECDATVLVCGETGTGKELAARAIHYLGSRRDFAFIPVNCGAIPDSLVENELFGHASGAYTDAHDTRSGVIADAEGGTLFLDEVETLSPRAQVALLRFLQDRHYRPLGGRQTLVANVRVIAASNADLSELVRCRSFRQDLQFRLNIMGLEMPPLRERRSDVPLLVEHFTRRFARQYGQPQKTLGAASRDRLLRYDWPGNVRELENLVHREFLLADGPEFEIPASALDPRRLTALVDQCSSGDARAFPAFKIAKEQAIANFERAYLAQLLVETNGNVSAAARRSGKERRALGRLLKKHGFDRAEYRPELS